MIQFIKHRVNRIADLSSVKPEWGVEIDLRSVVEAPGALHLSHDPWKRGDDFQEWLAAFKTQKIAGPLILNTKEDGLEETLIELLNAQGIKNYFFLDTAVPTLVRWAAERRRKNFAVRLSSFEGLENVKPFEGLVEWVWVDCFGGAPMPLEPVKRLQGVFKICLVSPELQGQPVDTISRFFPLGRLSDAICTKRPDLWTI